MLSIGIVYPELKILSKIDNIQGLENKAEVLNYTTILALENVENLTTLVSAIESNWNTNEYDFGIIFKDSNNNHKCYYIRIHEIISIEDNNIFLKAFAFGASKGVLKAWENYFSKGIEEPNLWTNLKQSERQGWLELAMAFQNVENSVSKSKATIDGKYIKSVEDFYCSLGEAINGSGGYFGRNHNALIDCIISREFGGNDIKKIYWRNSKKSRWKLKNHFKTILEVFKDYGIEIILE